MKNWMMICLLAGFCSCTSEETPVEDFDQEETVDSGQPAQNLEVNFEINGKISGAANQPLSLEATSNQGNIKLASSTIGQDGTFSMKGNIQGMGMYQLKLGSSENKVIPLTLEPKDKLVLNADFMMFERLPVLSGTRWSDKITRYMSKFSDFADKQISLSQRKDLTQDQQIAEFLKMRKPLDVFARDEMMKDPANPANIILMTSLTPAMGYDKWDASFLPALKKVSGAYNASYKDSPIAASMNAQVQEIEKGYADFLVMKSGIKTAPEIALKNPDGKTIKLSSLRGKIVLIDFWASWCGPCRKESPNVVKMYNKYKDKGFTVYSVSLDSDAAAWKRAIEADGLIWPNHVSDLLQWKTPLTQIYGFNSIPYTVLVNKEGKIIGTNLRGESLEQKLKEVL